MAISNELITKAEQWRMDATTEAAKELARLRQGTVRIQAAPGATVHIEQLRHHFEFGTPLSRVGSEEALDSFVAHWFNAGVIPVKWGYLEPNPGERRYEGPDRTLEWCEQHGFATRGHCLFYAHRIHVQEWVKALPKAEALRCMERHARETVRRYRGRIADYDLNNELLDGSWYRDQFGEDILRRMADWVLEEDPGVRLYVNEHDIVTGGDIDRYVELIDRLLSIGVPIRGIGVQGHLDPPFDLSQVKPVLDRLAQFGMPIKVTEHDTGIKLKEESYRGVSWIDGADKLKDLARFQEILDGYPADFEERKAAALEGMFRIVFAHPATRGMYIWGFREGSHWRTRGEIFHRDLTPLPAGEAFCRLLRQEWFTDRSVIADENGICALRAWYGRHRLTSRGIAREVELLPEIPPPIVDLTAPL